MSIPDIPDFLKKDHVPMNLIEGRKRRIFNKKILSFRRGAFFGGCLEIEIFTMSDEPDNVFVQMVPYNGFRVVYHMAKQEYLMPIIELEKIESFIQSILDWNPRYETEQDILDGYGWDIEFHYRNTDFLSAGYESYPDNYWEKVSELQTIIEDLCQKYNYEFYKPEERQLRIKL